MRNMVDYIAKIKPINGDKIETQAHGIATFSENGNSLHIHVEMFDTPANIERWEHFHGFPDGKQAHVPTLMLMMALLIYLKQGQYLGQRWFLLMMHHKK